MSTAGVCGWRCRGGAGSRRGGRCRTASRPPRVMCSVPSSMAVIAAWRMRREGAADSSGRALVEVGCEAAVVSPRGRCVFRVEVGFHAGDQFFERFACAEPCGECPALDRRGASGGLCSAYTREQRCGGHVDARVLERRPDAFGEVFQQVRGFGAGGGVGVEGGGFSSMRSGRTPACSWVWHTTSVICSCVVRAVTGIPGWRASSAAGALAVVPGGSRTYATGTRPSTPLPPRRAVSTRWRARPTRVRGADLPDRGGPAGVDAGRAVVR